MRSNIGKRVNCFGSIVDDDITHSSINENCIELRLVVSTLCWTVYYSCLRCAISNPIAIIGKYYFACKEGDIEAGSFRICATFSTASVSMVVWRRYGAPK